MMKTLLVLALSLFGVACSSGDPGAREDTISRVKTADQEETIGAEIAAGLNKPMNKAMNVENQVMDQKAKLDAALLEAEGTSQDP